MAGACKTSGTRPRPGIRRLLPDGMPDPAFTSLCWWGIDGQFLAMRATTPETIVAAGLARPPTGGWNYRIVIGHYLADGRADPAYGAQAFVTVPQLPFDPIFVRIQADGRVVAVDDGEQGDIHVARLNGDGTLDPSFGNGGVAHLPQPWQWDSWVQSLAIQRDGRILIGGSGARIDEEDGDVELMVGRLMPDGSLDDGFGDGGFVLTNVVPYPEGYLEVAYALAEAPDGKIVAGGTVWDPGDDGPIVLARFLGGTCGDAVLDAGERCDDGAANGTAASCCTADCTTRADGSACATGNACVEREACSAGACVGSAIACPACTACVPASGCVFEARTDCVEASDAPVRARFTLRRTAESRRDRIELEWKAGAPISTAALGDPSAGDRYALCVYRDDGASPALLFGAATRASDACGEQSCWRRKGDRFDYADRPGSPDGITRVRADARAGVVAMRGAGAALRLPELPLATPATVEVRVDGGACWRMPLDSTTVRRNDEGRVQAQVPAPARR
jgi:uncharacterized delta-60 repeat protein